MKSQTTGMPDRVWFSSGVKLNLGNYSSANVDIGMATDCRPGESNAAALKRCMVLVDAELVRQVRELKEKE